MQIRLTLVTMAKQLLFGNIISPAFEKMFAATQKKTLKNDVFWILKNILKT